MIYGSVCSGIEAASVAWSDLGWKPAFFSEIEDFPREVLKQRWPDVSLHGDFTTIGDDEYEAIELLVGGTPCQSFSVAGLRKGMADERGNLALEYLKLAQRKSPRWIVWENVPGVLSSNGGRDFGSFLGGLAELGYGFAYRVLDAQYFGVAQRRRRVFVVGYLGDWRRAAAVLFERHSVSGNPAAGREAEKAVAALTANGAGTCGADDNEAQVGNILPVRWPAEVASTLNASFGSKLGLEDQHINGGAPLFVDGSINLEKKDDMDLSVHCLHGTQDPDIRNNISHTIGRNYGQENVGLFTKNIMNVRRITPIECERLQGFPDNYTRIEYRKKSIDNCPDGPRYKAIGNSMAVPVMRWIGERIELVDAMDFEPVE